MEEYLIGLLSGIVVFSLISSWISAGVVGAMIAEYNNDPNNRNGKLMIGAIAFFVICFLIFLLLPESYDFRLILSSPNPIVEYFNIQKAKVFWSCLILAIVLFIAPPLFFFVNNKENPTEEDEMRARKAVKIVWFLAGILAIIAWLIPRNNF